MMDDEQKDALRRQQLYKDAAVADDCHQLVACDPHDILSVSSDLAEARATVRMLDEARAAVRVLAEALDALMDNPNSLQAGEQLKPPCPIRP